MNRKQLLILLVLVVVLGVAGWLISKRGQSEYQSTNKSLGQKLLGDFPVNDVARISVNDQTNELDLVRVGEVWCVRQRNNYPANFSEIRDLLLKLREIKIGQSEKVAPSDLGRLSLAPGSGANSPLVVDFKDEKDKSIRSLLLGKMHLRKGGGGPRPTNGRTRISSRSKKSAPCRSPTPLRPIPGS